MKKTSPTILEQAITAVPEFETVITKLSRQVTLRGQGKSTLNNYTRRIALTLMYSAGLRGQAVINLKIADIDFERMTIHIRQSKYKKDRIVPLSPTMAIGLKKYLHAENPHIWLFNGKEAGSRYSVKGLSWVMRENLKKTTITKNVNLHTLRHTYATHLLEEGINIVTLKELLGHADITTTMLYLYIAQCEHVKPHSPLDSLYGKLKKHL